MKTNNRLTINFVCESAKKTSGFTTYSTCLLQNLQKYNLKINNLTPSKFLNFPIRLLIREKGIIHFSNQTLVSPLILKSNEKTVVTVHDLIYLKYPLILKNAKHITFPIVDWWMYKQKLKSLKKAAKIIAVSANTKKDLIQLLDIPEDNIRVIHEGVSPMFKPVESTKVSNTILYVGNEHPHKNLKKLVLAFAQLKKVVPDAKLIKVGKPGWPGAREELVSLIKKLGITDSVVFKNKVNSIDKEYQKADLFVFPSLYEGFGLPVLEAMASGCPVITANSSSLPEITGKSALLIDPNSVEEITNAMETILKNDDLKRTLIKKGLNQSQKFSWIKTAKETFGIYKEMGDLE